MSNFFDLSGKAALVTGGAGGLGYGVAKGLAQAGADICIVSHSNSPEAVKMELESMGRKVHAIQADLSNETALPGVMQEMTQVFGKIDILVNNSGIIRRTPAADHRAQDWHDVLNLNLNAVFFLCQLAGKQMIEQGCGKIINIASMLSFQGGINVPGYTASKHGVAGLTKALANEWAKFNVNVNAIAPGYMVTNNTQQLREDPVRSKEILGRIPAGRWGSPEDLAAAAIFLSSSASDYVNGHVLCVDGGWMVR